MPVDLDGVRPNTPYRPLNRSSLRRIGTSSSLSRTSPVHSLRGDSHTGRDGEVSLPEGIRRPACRAQGRGDQAGEERVRLVGRDLNSGVGLGGHIERVDITGQLHVLDQPSVGEVPENTSPASASCLR